MRITGGKRAAVFTAGVMAMGLVVAGLPAGVAAQDQTASPAPAPVVTPEPAIDCARSDVEGALEMWERSGGNEGMVDQPVCDWNAANPDKPINLTYIPHVEMVSKIARGIATGDVPDLMGMDLIYAPQFENAGQLVDITDQIGPRRSSRRRARAT